MKRDVSTPSLQGALKQRVQGIWGTHYERTRAHLVTPAPGMFVLGTSMAACLPESARQDNQAGRRPTAEGVALHRHLASGSCKIDSQITRERIILRKALMKANPLN